MTVPFVLSKQAVSKAILALLAVRAEETIQLELLLRLPIDVSPQIDLQTNQISEINASIDELTRYQVALSLHALFASHPIPDVNQSL